MTEQEFEVKRERFYQLLQEDDSEPEIQYQLALCYLDGAGTAPDRERGMMYLTEAAENGFPEAMERLKTEQAPQAGAQSAGPAEDKEEERPLPELDRSTLPLWLERAEEGDAEALARVGIYSIDNGICSPAEGKSYLERAAEQGSSTAWTAMGSYLLKNAIPSREDPEEEAVLCFQNAAELGNPEAMSALADCYYTGTGIPKNEAQAGIWRERQANAAMEEDDPALCLEAGLDFYHGIYTNHSVTKAIQCFQRLKKSGDETALFWGEFYLAEDIWSQNPTPEEALRLLPPLADGGNPKAEYVLFVLYITGILPQLLDRYRLPGGWGNIQRAFGRGRDDEDLAQIKNKIETILPGCLTEGQPVSFDIEATQERNDILTGILMDARYRRRSNEIVSGVEKVSLILYKLLPLKIKLPAFSEETRDLWVEKANMGDAAAGWTISLLTYHKDKAQAKYWAEKAMENAARAEDGYSCERYAIRFLVVPFWEKSDEMAIKGFRLLQAIPKDDCKRRGDFRLAEMEWKETISWNDSERSEDEALDLLLPLADENNVRAEQTLLILFAAGIFPQLKERYTGPKGEERIRLTASESYSYDEKFCYLVGPELKDFFALVQNRDFLESCLAHAEDDIWNSIFRNSGSITGENLFQHHLLQSAGYDGNDDDYYDDEEETSSEDQAAGPTAAKAPANKTASQKKLKTLWFLLVILVAFFGGRHLWRNVNIPSSKQTISPRTIDISNCVAFDDGGTNEVQISYDGIVEKILALSVNKDKNTEKDKLYLNNLLEEGLSFTPYIDSGVSAGDQVTYGMVIDPDTKELLEKEYYTIIKDMTITGLYGTPDYLTSLDEISEEDMEALEWNSELFFMNDAKDNWHETMEIGEIEYLGSFLLTKNTPAAKNENILYVVHRIDCVIREDGKTASLSYYHYTAYYDLYWNSRGLAVNLSTRETPENRLQAHISDYAFNMYSYDFGGFKTVRTYDLYGYKTLDDLYNYCVNDHTGYNYESTVPGYY